MKLLIRSLLFMTVLVIVMANGPIVMAASEGNTYFRGVPNGNIVLIPGLSSDSDTSVPHYLGSNSFIGSVLPNWEGLNEYDYNTWNGGGAVGDKALKLNGSETNKEKKQKFLDFLKDKNKGTSVNSNSKIKADWQHTLSQSKEAVRQWEQMGSALVVHQMLGLAQNTQDNVGWGDTAKTIVDPGEWNELQARLVENDKVRMEKKSFNEADYPLNTSGVYVQSTPNVWNIFDAVRYRYGAGDGFGATMEAWFFYDDSSTNPTPEKPIYRLEIICANPMGDIGKLPSAPVKNDKYDLKPTASINGKTAVEPGGSVAVTNMVTNQGKDKSGSTTWRLTEMIFNPGTTLSPTDKQGRDNDSDPCATSGAKIFPTAGRTSCKTSPGQDKTGEVFDPGNPKTSNYTYSVPSNTPVGTKICFTVSVSKPTQDASPVWRHSDLQCIIVAKKPTVQVWGGDVRAGGTISTSTNTLDGKTYGSWGEYGALSNGSNSGFASGNGLNSGNANSAQSGWSSLTFANTGGTCTFGCYNFTLTSRSLTDQFGTGNTLPGGDINSWPNGTYATNGLTLSGITINKGKSIVIISTGTVTINGDIAYNDGPYTSLKDIPQLVIRAPVINIQGNVGRVDAWLFAITATNSGVLNTCSDVGVDAQLTANICNNQLAINGPVVADKIYLRRTAGSDGSEPTRGRPAETFNLRADAYLWGSGYTNGKGKVRTVYTKELPPRF